ncbi:ATP-binding protein [Marinifilum sp. D714]|uniref:ATP-binding protein n=1 Tax=Marinifilum sp. D714 TaxID=2937523 RepID=UPI0027C8D4A1|nr:transporter substrate-binding domain-containing protein [Marinifilum sp. D714]MDQ2179783.1 transporter substrate-binding domain-containing protein [Marinifilum sp. D714]
MGRKTHFIFLLLSLLIILSCSRKEYDILTFKERQWLEEHPSISIAVSSVFPPFQYTDEEGKSVGISIDILSLLETKLDYKFKKVIYPTWKDILQAGINKDVDIILEIQETPYRRKHFFFTEPFISIPHVIFMRNDAPENVKIEELENIDVGVVDNYAIQEHLEVMYPEINLVPFKSDLECLLKLSAKKINVVITQQGYGIHVIHNQLIPNVKIVGNANYDNKLGFAIRNDQPMLARIISKGLAEISPKEQSQIYNHYIQINSRPFWQKPIFWRSLVATLLIFALGLLLMWIWNKALRKNVAKQTKELKKAKEKAEESSTLKSSFLANMSHEIRTPLNAIQGFSELLISKDLSQEKTDLFANIIRSNCNDLTHLIEEILDVSIIESGQIKLAYQEFNIVKLIKDIVEIQTQNITQKKNLKIRFLNQLNTDDFKITADQLRVKQIFNNLIENAIKFTDSGTISVYASYNSDSELIFCIEDTGIGIEPSSLNYIFDRFRKIEIDKTVLYRGSGLGLNICKKLLQIMGGQIWVKSKYGEGSSFYFTLPIR